MRHHAKVLYVLDGEFSEFKTLEQVLDLAEKYQLELTLLDVTRTIAPADRLMIASMPLSDLRNHTLAKRLESLEAFISLIGRRSCKLRARTAFGNRSREIVSEAAQGDYELVVKRRDKGTTDRRISSNCHCPVWVLKPEDFTESGQIIVSKAPRIASRNNSQTGPLCTQRL